MDEGILFRKLRKDRGFSIEQISDEMNSMSFISKFEKGNSNISLHRIERLLENINVSMEEFLYLRELEKNPNLNEDIKVMRGHLTSEFYYYVARINNITKDVNKMGYKKSIINFEKVKSELDKKINWQKFLIIYCEVSIFIYEQNMLSDEEKKLAEENPKQRMDDLVAQMNLMTKPIVAYLFKVDDWGVFEIILFRMFIFTFELEQINQLLPLAISRTQKEGELHVMSNSKLDIIFSSFSYFANFRHQKWAEKALKSARELLKDQKDLTNSTLLLFYEGWYKLIFEDYDKGLQSCHQAISIFKILEQPTFEKNFKNILVSVLENQKEPEKYLIFV